ncbi:MAG: radical SAM protein [Polyangiaceae bacterium]
MLCLVLEHDCNLRCDYCYTGEKRPAKMSRETAKRAIDFALAQNPDTFSLSFFGGEPLLNPDTLEFAVHYTSEQLATLLPEVPWIVILSTNATLIDETLVDELRRLPNAGGLRVHVSLDGPEQIHDAHRRTTNGQGSHAAVRRAITLLKEHRIPVLPVATINPDTAAHLGDITRELVSVAKRRALFSFNLRASWDASALADLRKGLRDACLFWAECFREGREVILEPLAGKILNHLHEVGACPGRCQMALDDIVVAPSGRIYPCGEMVGADSDVRLVIGDVWNGFDRDRVARLLAQKSRVEQTCGACGLRSRCDSACACRHLALTGTLGEITETLCELEEALVEAADTMAETLWAEQCGTFLHTFYRTQWQLLPGASLLRPRR